ncbi:MAG: SCP2 sterol-binding domain-containing protein [Gammaproteobacteria bacterium]|nr:SCP2 sterol-binding domain-containing protein [Gammaproteobacteria bacterium]MDH4253736.1 SCP2 sterol-binding domain-containing protein [Gammaproteobacteria bacterium]MDH5309665.1 SCP2 sterol-binding domain-containing protein [Gammaproteobacteria bacterium]
MDALAAMLRPIIGMVNRQIAAKSPARELCAELDGRIVTLRVRDTALAVSFRVGQDALEFCSGVDEPDVAITGSLFALASLAMRSGERLIRDGSIDLIGDAEIAQSFQRLLAYGRPDIEEELSGVLGDVAAHGVGDVARAVGRWARDAHETMRQNLTEYLQEESRVVPSRYEADAFRAGVERLRDDVERAEVRIRRLEDGTS